jgi:hypothetical protein
VCRAAWYVACVLPLPRAAVCRRCRKGVAALCCCRKLCCVPRGCKLRLRVGCCAALSWQARWTCCVLQQRCAVLRAACRKLRCKPRVASKSCSYVPCVMSLLVTVTGHVSSAFHVGHILMYYMSRHMSCYFSMCHVSCNIWLITSCTGG